LFLPLAQQRKKLVRQHEYRKGLQWGDEFRIDEMQRGRGHRFYLLWRAIAAGVSLAANYRVSRCRQLEGRQVA
jgi:hypothetical protein